MNDFLSPKTKNVMLNYSGRWERTLKTLHSKERTNWRWWTIKLSCGRSLWTPQIYEHHHPKDKGEREENVQNHILRANMLIVCEQKSEYYPTTELRLKKLTISRSNHSGTEYRETHKGVYSCEEYIKGNSLWRSLDSCTQAMWATRVETWY